MEKGNQQPPPQSAATAPGSPTAEAAQQPNQQEQPHQQEQPQQQEPQPQQPHHQEQQEEQQQQQHFLVTQNTSPIRSGHNESASFEDGEEVLDLSQVGRNDGGEDSNIPPSPVATVGDHNPADGDYIDHATTQDDTNRPQPAVKEPEGATATESAAEEEENNKAVPKVAHQDNQPPPSEEVVDQGNSPASGGHQEGITETPGNNNTKQHQPLKGEVKEGEGTETTANTKEGQDENRKGEIDGGDRKNNGSGKKKKKEKKKEKKKRRRRRVRKRRKGRRRDRDDRRDKDDPDDSDGGDDDGSSGSSSSGSGSSSSSSSTSSSSSGDSEKLNPPPKKKKKQSGFSGQGYNKSNTHNYKNSKGETQKYIGTSSKGRKSGSTKGQKGDRNPRKKNHPEEQDLSEMSKFRYKQHLTMDECSALIWGFDEIQSVDVNMMRSFIDMNLPDMDSSNKKALLKAVGEGDIAWWGDMRDGMQRMPQGMVIQNKTASNNNRSMSMMPPGAQGYGMGMYQSQGFDRQGYPQTYSNNPYGMHHANRFVPPPLPSYIPHQYAIGGYPGGGDQGGGDGKVPGGNGPPEDGLLRNSSHGSKKKAPPPTSNRKKKTKGGAAKRSREEDTYEEEDNKEDKKLPAKKEGKKLPAKKAVTKKVKKEKGDLADDDSSSDSSEDDEVEVGVKRSTRQGSKKGDHAYGSDMEEVENSSFGLIHCVFPNKLDAEFEPFHNNRTSGGNRDPITVVASEMNDMTPSQAKYTGTTVWSPKISTIGIEKWSWSSIRSDYQKKFLITYVKKISGIGKGVGQSNKIKVSAGEHLENQLPPRGANMPETISIFQGPLNAVQPMIRYRNVDNCDIPIPGNCMMVGTKNKAYSCSCSSHPAGCGPHLELGQDVLVYGPNIRHLVGGVYRIGCHVLLPGRRIGCKVGYVRVMYEQLHLFVNRVGTVTYIAPEPSTKKGGKAYDVLYKECVGYCHLSFFHEGEGFVRNPANRKKGGWEYLELPTKEGLDQKGQGTKDDLMMPPMATDVSESDFLKKQQEDIRCLCNDTGVAREAAWDIYISVGEDKDSAEAIILASQNRLLSYESDQRVCFGCNERMTEMGKNKGPYYVGCTNEKCNNERCKEACLQCGCKFKFGCKEPMIEPYVRRCFWCMRTIPDFKFFEDITRQDVDLLRQQFGYAPYPGY